MVDIFDDKILAYVSTLAKLELTVDEKDRAQKDMSQMLAYLDKLNELDTEGIEPMLQVFVTGNAFREDVVTNQENSEMALQNAPKRQGDMFVVPSTI